MTGTISLIREGTENRAFRFPLSQNPVRILALYQRRDVRAVEGARLESACMLTRCTEGSNPSLSARLRSLTGASSRQAIFKGSEGCRVEVHRTKTGQILRPFVFPVWDYTYLVTRPGCWPGCRFMGLKARPFSDVGSRTPPDPEGSNGRNLRRVLQPAWPSSHPFDPVPPLFERGHIFPRGTS